MKRQFLVILLLISTSSLPALAQAGQSDWQTPSGDLENSLNQVEQQSPWQASSASSQAPSQMGQSDWQMSAGNGNQSAMQAPAGSSSMEVPGLNNGTQASNSLGQSEWQSTAGSQPLTGSVSQTQLNTSANNNSGMVAGMFPKPAGQPTSGKSKVPATVGSAMGGLAAGMASGMMMGPFGGYGFGGYGYPNMYNNPAAATGAAVGRTGGMVLSRVLMNSALRHGRGFGYFW